LPLVEKEIVPEEKDKPVLDEQTLDKLLEAAYVLQEHNREVQEMELDLSLKRDQIEAEERTVSTPHHGEPQAQATESTANADYTFTLAKIVETQHQIQVRHLESESAMALVAERLTQIARANGAAIGTLAAKSFHYRAVAGQLTLPAGTDVSMEKALCVACLRTGQVVRCADVNSEFLLDTDECHRRGIGSLIAVPVFHDGEVVGGLELYYSTGQGFTEQDVHTCQLMAGLVTEALARDEEVTWKKSLATERAVMIEALEKLKPNLAALIDRPSAKEPAAKPSSASSATDATTFTCRKCGHKIVGEEQFCGNCGTPRSSDYEPPSMQSKVASLWHMQEATKNSATAEIPQSSPLHLELRARHEHSHGDPLADSLEEQMPELFKTTEQPVEPATKSGKSDKDPISVEFEESAFSDLEIPLDASADEKVNVRQSTALAKSEHTGAWSSAASARNFLEQLALEKRPGALTRFWNSRRGDIYLAIAVLLVAVVIRWGIWSNHSVSATGNPTTAAATDHRKPAPDADISTFDRMLISLGLAEAPPAPENKGNPEAQVWVDLHTGLYYCAGTDLYGKTPKGKYTLQRDAQLDQFEPAYRKTCD
jgi:putative methionine-R-sulfoxide reductase with GAF domain/ribosomal protein L37E